MVFPQRLTLSIAVTLFFVCFCNWRLYTSVTRLGYPLVYISMVSKHKSNYILFVIIMTLVVSVDSMILFAFYFYIENISYWSRGKLEIKRKFIQSIHLMYRECYHLIGKFKFYFCWQLSISICNFGRCVFVAVAVIYLFWRLNFPSHISLLNVSGISSSLKLAFYYFIFYLMENEILACAIFCCLFIACCCCCCWGKMPRGQNCLPTTNIFRT